MKKIVFCLSLLMFVISVVRAAETDELVRIRQNYVRSLLPSGGEQEDLVRYLQQITPESEMSDQVVMELHQLYPFDLKKIQRYLSSLKADGTWPDINYDDKKRSGWEPKMHAERILELAKLYRSDKTEYKGSSEVSKVIHTALNYWFTAKPVCLNWWYNQIGIPKTMGAAFILLEDELSPAEKQSAIEVLEHAKFGMTGQNKVWLAGNVLMRALLQNDYPLVKEARDIIASEIMTGGKEGIKEDWSFHQHGAQQQFGNYGLSFLSGMSFFAGLFSGTSFAFDDKQMEILNTLLIDGYRWVIWRGEMDINSLDRQLFHNAPIHKALSVGFVALTLGNKKFVADNFPPRKSGSTFTGHKHFWQSDYTIHRRPSWMASVKMSSERVIGSEQVNEDNLLGYYMGDGATYIYEDTNDYLNVFPFWDWRKIPGITSYESNEPVRWKRGKQAVNDASFVGGVSDGRQGMTVMDFNKDGIQARKAWVMTDNFVLCLGAGIQSDSALTVTTSIDQRLKRDNLLVLQKNKWEIIEGTQLFDGKEQRFFHGRTGYILLGNSSVNSVAHSEKRTGQWCDFMQMYRPQPVEGEVVSLHIDHGVHPQKATYQYLLLPSVSCEQTAAFDLSSVKILRNDENAQIVFAADNYYIVAYQPLKIKLASGLSFEAVTPGVYMIMPSDKNYKVAYADPTQQQSEAKAIIDKKEIHFSVASGKMDGTTIIH